jgi:tetratricopeptide (TPR) repeat protein
MSDRRQLEERLEIATRDLTELADQVEAGEIDEATAETLQANYQAEVDSVEAELGSLPAPNRKRPTEPETQPPGMQSRSTRRAVVGSVLVIAALSVAIFLAAGEIDSSPATTAAGSAAPGGLTIDPNSVSNEQLEEVVAQNPAINAMRMALADRYFEQEDYGKALDHYLTIAENNPTPAEEGRALTRVGWMAYTTGQPEAAQQYLQTSLTVDPTNEETKLFLGFVLLYGLDDPDGALPWLEEVAEISELPPSILTQVETAIAEARGTG